MSLIANYILKNKLECISLQIQNIVIQDNSFKIVLCTMLVVCFGSQYTKVDEIGPPINILKGLKEILLCGSLK